MKVNNSAYLVLEDGSVYRGSALGARTETIGEIVFNTSMTGYQEMLTDPSYKNQLLTLTYPLIGNYGINSRDIESNSIQAAGLIVKEAAEMFSHNDGIMTLNEYLSEAGVCGISGVDTRAITRKIRQGGVMMAAISSDHNIAAVTERVQAAGRYGSTAMAFSSGSSIDSDPIKDDSTVQLQDLTVAVIDYGVKLNIVRLVSKQFKHVKVVGLEEIEKTDLIGNVDAIILSPGPGDPSLEVGFNQYIRKWVEAKIPVLGICLGHQLLAHTLGGTTYKLKFGHRGGNQPVMDLRTGSVMVTAHNHGYAVSKTNLPDELEVTHINLNDQTIEGLRHKELPIMSIQFHAEASPGPLDAEVMFGQFVDLVKETRQ